VDNNIIVPIPMQHIQTRVCLVLSVLSSNTDTNYLFALASMGLAATNCDVMLFGIWEVGRRYDHWQRAEEWSLWLL